MAEAAGMEAVQKIKNTAGIMRNVLFTTKDKAFELVGDTKAEVQNAVNKTKAAALNVKTSGNSLVQGVKNLFGVVSNSGSPSKNLVTAVPEAGLPKGQVDFITGHIQEGAKQRRQRIQKKRGGSRRQESANTSITANTRKEGMNNAANLKKVYLMTNQEGVSEYLPISEYFSHQQKLNRGEINASSEPDGILKTNPKKKNSSAIVIPLSDIKVETNSNANKITGFSINGNSMSIKKTLNRYKNYNPENNAPVENAPLANNGASHKYVESLETEEGKLYYVLPNGEVSWDKPEGDYIILPKNWSVNTSGNSIKFSHYNTGKVVTNVPTANTPISNNAPVAVEEAPTTVEEASTTVEETPAAAVNNAPVAKNNGNKPKSAFNALMGQINSLEAKLKEIKNNTGSAVSVPSEGGVRRRRHRTKRRRQTKRPSSSRRAHSRRRR